MTSIDTIVLPNTHVVSQNIIRIIKTIKVNNEGYALLDKKLGPLFWMSSQLGQVGAGQYFQQSIDVSCLGQSFPVSVGFGHHHIMALSLSAGH